MLSPLNLEQARMPFLSTPIQHCTGSSRWFNKTRKKNVCIEKEEIKLSLLPDDMIV